MHDSEKFYRSLFENNSQPVIIADDSSGRVTAVNKAALRLYGYRKKEFLSLTIDHLIAPVKATDLRRAAFGGNQNFKHAKKNGQLVEVKTRTNVIYCGATRFRVINIEDETEKLNAERAVQFMNEASILLASSLEYEDTLNKIIEMAVRQFGGLCVFHLLSPDGHLILEGVGHKDPLKSARYRECSLHYPLDRQAAHGAAKVIRTGKSELVDPVTDEYVKHNTFDARHYETTKALNLKSIMYTPLQARGRTLGTMTVISAERHFTRKDLLMAEDLSRRFALAIDNSRLYQRSLEAIQLRDEFVSIASHELRTPITSIRLQLQFMKHFLVKEKADAPVWARFIKMVNAADRQLDRVTRLVQDLLDVSRIRTGQLNLELEWIDLAELVESVVERFRDELVVVGCPLTVTKNPCTQGHWDKLRVEQIVTNLLTNAMKYGAHKPVELVIGQEGPWAVLKVRDHGIGIKSEDQQRIFNKFERAVSSSHFGGLGLGLFIVHQIVSVLNGKITLTSKCAEGSEFVVRLPLVKA